MDATLWQRCIRRLEGELSVQQLNTWIRPLQAVEEPQLLRLYAPNRFVVDWISEHYLDLVKGKAVDEFWSIAPVTGRKILKMK